MTLHISLSEEMRSYVESRVASGDFADATAFVHELILHDQQELEALRAAIQEGLDSGDSPHSIDEIFANAKRRYLEDYGS
jgi:antitoxin ParD1/3/4